MGERWRTGRKAGRTIYRQVGPEPSDDDVLIGVMDTPAFAARVVAAVNRDQWEIEPVDLDIETRPSPHDRAADGGMRGIWMRHRPTGIETSCDEERSQLMNKVRCLEEIRAALAVGVPGNSDG